MVRFVQSRSWKTYTELGHGNWPESESIYCRSTRMSNRERLRRNSVRGVAQQICLLLNQPNRYLKQCQIRKTGDESWKGVRFTCGEAVCRGCVEMPRIRSGFDGLRRSRVDRRGSAPIGWESGKMAFDLIASSHKMTGWRREDRPGRDLHDRSAK